MSDTWNGYSFLDENSLPQPYFPDSVNHSTNYIGPETGAIKPMNQQSSKYHVKVNIIDYIY